MKTNIKRLGAGLGVLTALAWGGAAHAQGTVTWRGNVDDVTRIMFRGSNVNAFAVSGDSPSGVSVRRSGNLSFTNRARVSLQTISGRGSVSVVQTPDRSNNYTTIVEVRDPQPGEATYEFRLRTSDTNGRYDDYNDRPYDRDGYNDRDDQSNGRWNRRDDDYRGNGRWNRRDDDNRGNGRWNNRDDRNNGRWDNGNGNGRWNNRGNNRVDTSLPSDPAARIAYLLGVTQGQRDYEQRRDRDYSRYGARFNSRTEADFRRGYNNGFDGYDSPRNR